MNKPNDVIGGSGTTNCSTAIDASKIRAQRMAITRDRLDRSEIQRQRAVCMFPLRVAQVAEDMRKMLDLVEQMGECEDSKKYLLYGEDLIREEYRSCFGRELGQ